MAAKIGVACDHAGKELKALVSDFVKLNDFEVVDYGVSTDNNQSVDYPDYAEILASDISTGKLDKGILICGTGIGMAIAANKFPGIRAANIYDEFTARNCKAHNNANIICIGSRVINHHRAADLIKIWLETEFEGNRHTTRLDKVREIEKKTMQPS